MAECPCPVVFPTSAAGDTCSRRSRPEAGAPRVHGQRAGRVFVCLFVLDDTRACVHIGDPRGHV